MVILHVCKEQPWNATRRNSWLTAPAIGYLEGGSQHFEICISFLRLIYFSHIECVRHESRNIYRDIVAVVPKVATLNEELNFAGT